MSSYPREGVVAALWTPTDANGGLQADALAQNVSWMRARGVHGLMVLGSTGEFPRLSLEQRQRLLEAVSGELASLPCLVNVSDVRLEAVIALGKSAARLGAPAISLLAPWFFALAQEDLAEFFIRAAAAIGLPLFLYNFPERTGHRLALETIAAVADRVQLAGVKQSGAEFGYHRELVALGREKGFIVFTGGETRLAEAMQLGITGCVSGLANAVPELVVGVYNDAKAGRFEAAGRATDKLRRLCDVMGRLEFPLNVAAVIEARGLNSGESKTPLSAATRACYRQVVAEVRQLLAEWGLVGG